MGCAWRESVSAGIIAAAIDDGRAPQTTPTRRRDRRLDAMLELNSPELLLAAWCARNNVTPLQAPREISQQHLAKWEADDSDSEAGTPAQQTGARITISVCLPMHRRKEPAPAKPTRKGTQPELDLGSTCAGGDAARVRGRRDAGIGTLSTDPGTALREPALARPPRELQYHIASKALHLAAPPPRLGERFRLGRRHAAKAPAPHHRRHRERPRLRRRRKYPPIMGLLYLGTFLSVLVFHFAGEWGLKIWK